MGVGRWLQRWDRRNQTIFDGEIPDDVRQRWRWNRELDGNGDECLTASRFNSGRVVLDSSGIHSRSFRARNWKWERVAWVTWEVVPYSASLAVCIYGDPYVKDLAWGHGDRRVCRAMLDDCRTFVELRGAQVRNTVDPAPSMWWADQPEAQWGFTP